jgi:hypothetical protein
MVSFPVPLDEEPEYPGGDIRSWWFPSPSPVLRVYFGTPNMFITLWFRLDYETNPPLGTLMI